MIKTEAEYKECLQRLEQDRAVIEAQRTVLQKMELDAKQVETALEPLYSFHEQLQEEIEWYERVKRRDFQPLKNLSGLGQLLIALRISKGYTQSELARRLSVDVSQVSRDERNEYHGVSIDRVQRILNSLNVRLVSSVEFESVSEEDVCAAVI